MKALLAVYSGMALPVIAFFVEFSKGDADIGVAARSFSEPVVLWPSVVGGVIVALLVLSEERITAVRKHALRAGAYTSVAIALPATVLYFGFGADPYFLLYCLIYAPTIGVVGGLLRYTPDLSVAEDLGLSEETRRAILDKNSELLWKGLNVFSTLYFTLLISSAVGYSAYAFRTGATSGLIATAGVVGYLAAGVIPGVYLRVFRIAQSIKDAYSSIRVAEEGGITEEEGDRSASAPS